MAANNVEFVWQCQNAKCDASVPSDQLNAVKLKAVKYGPVECKRCGKSTKWMETAMMKMDIQPTEQQPESKGQNNERGSH